MSHIAYVNGRYVPQGAARIHIEDRGYQFADGVYEVVCIWNGLPVDYAGHMARLNRSLRELRLRSPATDGALTVIAKEIVRRNRVTKGTLYIQVNRGVAPRAHPFPNAAVPPSLILTAKHGAGPSDAVAEQGVKVVTAQDMRWERCDIKSVGLLPNVMARQVATEAKAYEALLVTPDNVVTEASASNAWIVTKDKTLVTHPTTQAILGGITRATLMRLAKDAGYAIAERPFTLDEARAAKEVFLTGTTTFVMPVVQIDDQPVGNGAPGNIALELRGLYRRFMDSITPQMAWNV
jgi:D-alanine transaminase